MAFLAVVVVLRAVAKMPVSDDVEENAKAEGAVAD
jgi:hypothetical protein